MTILEFWDKKNGCREKDCEGRKRARAILAQLVDEIPTTEALDAAMSAEADEPAMIELERCSRAIRHMLCTAGIIAMYAATNKNGIPLRQMAGMMFTTELAKASQITDIRIPVAMMMPPADVAEAMKAAAAASGRPTKES